MNLITSNQLDQSQRKAIHELTLKKRQSKKSTMSERQLAAKQQLARELMLVRIIPIEDSILAHNSLTVDSVALGDETTSSSKTITTTPSNPSITTTNDNDQVEPDEPSTSGSIDTSSGCCPSMDASSSASSPSIGPSERALQLKSAHNLTHNHLQQAPHLSSPTCSSCGCSFGRSDSSYSGSSQASAGSARMLMPDETGSRQEEDLRSLNKEANIKFQKTRLEHLNEELQRKLYQYEYLVTKEKALLGAYNMVLFTNEGVNNFY